MKGNGRRFAAAGLGTAVCGLIAAAALASPPSQIVSSNLVEKADVNTPVDIAADGIRLRTRAPTDVRVQKLVFAPGGRTGWHHHAGIVLVAVQSGQVTVVGPRCRKTTYGPGSPKGSVFTEVGTRPREVRNLSRAEATVYATLIAPNAETDIFRAEDPVRPCP